MESTFALACGATIDTVALSALYLKARRDPVERGELVSIPGTGRSRGAVERE
ncbi:hypothetical protein PPSIR1_41874 [Plesiocystis pacifica SIR-1]|uniref:Uncharacterized protein n=1 Tax=Plesiocystis pacifica SIR-1 TaxID=391625 RepID=A6G0W6_9BACT|nr:hypothetical protein PPSIR1_41874 [Plesiocystis pacifica SIR-1]